MHQQIKGSPDSFDANKSRIENVLARAGIAIESIGPDVDPPHVRVLVKHAEPYNPADPNDTFNKALAALRQDGLAPEAKAAVTLTMPNKPRVQQAALDRLARDGFVVESVLTLATGANGVKRTSFGIARGSVDGWGPEADALQRRLEKELKDLPDA